MTPRILAILCATPLLAQSIDPRAPGLTPPVAAAPAGVPVHTNATVPGELPYGVWAAGDAYKARFDGGMTFIPLLGADYPHNQPFAWRTTSVRVGANELLAVGVEPAMTTREWRVEYAHGPVVEAYDVLAHGLEQTFVFRTRPAGEGDLCITGACDTMLAAEAVENVVADVAFRDANGDAILSYGRAVAIDADGDRFVVRTTVQGNAITLRMAGADLARADFPLVVDPLLAASYGGTLATATAVGAVELACETVSPSITAAAAFTRHYSATDADVIVRVSSSGYQASTQVFSDLLASTSAQEPSLAHVAATNRWLLVYQSFVTAAQTMHLRAVTFDGGTNTPVVSSQVPQALPANAHAWRPAVSGIAENGAGSAALVVFQREDGTAAFANTATSGVWGTFFDTTAVPGTWSPPFPIFDNGAFDYERPSVNRTAEGGAAFSRFVVCQAFENAIAADDWDLVGCLVDQGSTLSATTWTSPFLAGSHKLGPVVDGRNGRFCLAFNTVTASIGKIADTIGMEVRTRRLDWLHGSAAPTADAAFTVETQGADANRVLEVTGIAHNGGTRSHWALVWRSNAGPAIFTTRVGFQGKALQAPDLVASASGTVGMPLPGQAGILHHDDFGTTTVAYQLLNGGNAEIWSRRFDYPNPAFAVMDAQGCGSWNLLWGGPAGPSIDRQRIGCEFSGPHVLQAPPNSLHLVLVATATANIPLVDPIVGPGCALLVPFSGPDYLGYLPLAVGNAVQWQLPLPETLPPMTLWFQDWALDPATNQFTSSQRLKVELVK